MGILERLGLIDKSPEQIKKETEESNEENYREHFRIVRHEEREYKKKYKEIIEYRLKKPIEQATLLDLIKCGFDSKYLLEIPFEELDRL